MNEKQEAKGLSCLGKTVIALIVLPLVLVACVLVWWFSRNAIAQGRLDERIAALEADGMPVDNDSLQVYYNQQTEGSEVELWTSVADRVESPEFRAAADGMPVLAMGEPIPHDPETPWPDEAKVRDFLKRQDFLYDQLDDLQSTRGSVRYPIEFVGYDTLLKYVQTTRGMARLMTVRHDVAIRDGDSDAATASVLSTLAIARTLENQPGLVSQLVRIAIMGVAIDGLRSGLDADVYQADQLSRIREALSRRSDESEQLRVGIIGERAWVLSAIQSGGVPGGAPRNSIAGKRPIDGLAAIDFFDQVLETIDDDIYDTKAAHDVLSDEMQRKDDQAGLLTRFDTMLTSMLRPAFDQGGTAFARNEMSCRLAETAIAVRLYRFENEQWPGKLGDLTAVDWDGAVQKPIGDKPFGYQVTDDVALVWGFPITPQPDFQPMSETPDQPPLADDFAESRSVFRLRAD